MRESIKKLLKSAVTTICPRLTAEILFYSAFRRKLDLKHPKTLDEKLNWLKLYEYGKNPLVSQCVDKYRVREYVRERGLEHILNTCLAVYDRPEDIVWSDLPERFVLKCNHGCAYNILCPDKSKLDQNQAMRSLKSWMREDYWRLNAELNYRGIPKKIIAETYLESENGEQVVDYKLYCFHGKPHSVLVCVGREGMKAKFYFFDREWNLLRINPDSQAAPEGFTLPKPAVVDDLFRYAGILSEPFRFVRVDFYVVDNRVVFGELTFTPASAMDRHRLPQTDRMLGELLKLPFEEEASAEGK